MFAYCVVSAYVIDAAVGRVVLSLPVPVPEEVVAAPLVFENEYSCSSAQRERERKHGEEHKANTHR